MPTGEVAALRPMISDPMPQDSIVRESSGNASPSEMVKTQTAAHAATTLRKLISDAGLATRNSHATTRMGRPAQQSAAGQTPHARTIDRCQLPAGGVRAPSAHLTHQVPALEAWPQ